MRDCEYKIVLLICSYHNFNNNQLFDHFQMREREKEKEKKTQSQ